MSSSLPHLPPPPYSGGSSHRAGRSVFSAMKLGKNRLHKEETQRQGTDVCPCPRPAISAHLTVTKPLPSAGSTPTVSPVIGQWSHLGGAWPPIGWWRNPVLTVVLKEVQGYNGHHCWSKAEQSPLPSGPVYERPLLPSVSILCSP